MLEKSRTMCICMTLLNMPLQIVKIFWLIPVSYDFELVDLLIHQYIHLRESIIDLKH
jgi:hypothetical protein